MAPCVLTFGRRAEMYGGDEGSGKRRKSRLKVQGCVEMKKVKCKNGMVKYTRVRKRLTYPICFHFITFLVLCFYILDSNVFCFVHLFV